MSPQLQKEKIMSLSVVGWGCQDGEVCALCRKNKATIYVTDTEDGDMNMIPACDTCVPSDSCPDPIADLFTQFLESSAN
jgi:hypothetical protein